jgi:hypothetical protein
MKQPIIFLILFLTLLFTSCKKQKITSTEKPPLPSCTIEEIDFKYLTSKAKLNYKDNYNNDLKTNAHLRMRKDSIIWISINAAAGFEAARCLIKPDSIHILDRMKNEYIVMDYKSLSEKFGIELNYGIIQNMLLGNPIFPKSENDEVIQSDTNYCVFKQSKGDVALTNYVTVFNSKLGQAEALKGKASLIIKYLNFVPLGSYSFASKNEISLLIPKENDSITESTTIEIDHNKTELSDKELNFPFNIPPKFTRR